MPSRIHFETCKFTVDGVPIHVEQLQFDFSSLPFAVTREPPIDPGAPHGGRIAGADSNGGVLTNNTRYYVYGLYPPWTRHTMEVAMGLRVHVVSMSRVRLYLPRSRRHDYPEVKAWIKHNAPLHVRATLYLERRR